ncbi:MAG: tetratricopeptide repeat protein [Bacteroidetes bacterium]|nr:tetratricopeptide repeat protein [Bacteroidota bacterium]MBU1115108.1 tetratricopeptide repeat protein [Bacteroidota bacterium]MBU1800079.1 tetratricopeptide repeat protein [Bacteroidota bacterium]
MNTIFHIIVYKKKDTSIKHLKQKYHFFYFLLFLSFIVSAKTNELSYSYFQKRIQNLNQLDEKTRYNALTVLIGELITNSDTAFIRKQIENVITVTSEFENSKSYTYALVAYAQCRTKKALPNLNKALKIAKTEGYYDLIGLALEAKSIVYRESEMYDSLIVTLIEAKNHYEKTKNIDELVAILHLTGEVYYNAGLYNKAENIFNDILVKKGNKVEWEIWRHVVVINNLGLIEMEQGNFNKAIQYFNTSLELNNKKEKNSGQEISIGYIQQKLAICYFELGDDKTALLYYNQSLEKCLSHKMYKQLIGLYCLKARLLLNQNKFNSALHFCDLAANIITTNKISQSQMVLVYKLYSTLYEKLNDNDKAMFYYKNYTILKDSIENSAKNARHMQILAENDYEKANSKIKFIQTKYNFIIAFFIVTAVLLTIIIIYYFRLKKSYSVLVLKNIESVGIVNTTNSFKKHDKNKNNKRATEDIQEDIQEDNKDFYKELVDKFIKYMETETIYLNKEITINEVAEKLVTNRTYLSKAINLVMNKTFNVCINELRIKEAIRRISSGKVNKMTLEGIASEVGFNNRNTFTSSFRKYTGVLPSYFINEISKKH